MISLTAPPTKVNHEVVPKRFSIFASVKMSVTLFVLVGATILIGAWCPQEAQVGQSKVIEQFGEETALKLTQLGITDIFHSPWFLFLIGLLSINMIVASFQRVFPKVLLLKQPLPWLKGPEVSRLPFNDAVILSANFQQVIKTTQRTLELNGYKVLTQGNSLVAESGKYGRLAASVTHIGLLSLLLGVSITSWTGFTGFQPIPLGGSLFFGTSEHSKLWVGKLPDWHVRVDATRRENYKSGDPKQWYSALSVIDSHGKVVKTQEISVNNPLTYDGVDIYQSSWGLDKIALSFNGHKQALDLRPMGKTYAAFMPLDSGTILIFSVRDQGQPLRLFGKTPDWTSPKMLTEIPPGSSSKLGNVILKYERAMPVTGLQYKCDPGLPITFMAFGFIMLGVVLAAVPYRQVWGYVADQELNELEYSTASSTNKCILVLGGRSLKAKTAFEKNLLKILNRIKTELGETA